MPKIDKAKKSSRVGTPYEGLDHLTDDDVEFVEFILNEEPAKEFNNAMNETIRRAAGRFHEEGS